MSDVSVDVSDVSEGYKEDEIRSAEFQIPIHKMSPCSLGLAQLSIISIMLSYTELFFCCILCVKQTV